MAARVRKGASIGRRISRVGFGGEDPLMLRWTLSAISRDLAGWRVNAGKTNLNLSKYQED